MLKRLVYLFLALALLWVSWFSGHLSSPDSHTVQKLGEAQRAYIGTRAEFDDLCQKFLQDQSKLESRLIPGEVLHTFQCSDPTSTSF